MNRRFMRYAIVLLVLTQVGSIASAGDWPQILGPNRNGQAEGEKIADHWPAAGPKVVWQREVGGGFAGVAVSRGKAMLFHRQNDREVLEALDAVTGKPIWKTDSPANYQPTIIDDDGPRAVPVISGSQVFTYGASGELRCVEFATGNVIWTRDTYNDFNSKHEFHGEPPQGYFGFASSPIADGDKVIVNIGGDTSHSGIVAFSVRDGSTVWKATDERASYSSPVITKTGDTRHLIVVTRLNVISLDPSSGKERFRFGFGRVGPTVNAATPLVIGSHLFVTSSYGIGAVYAKLLPTRADIEWRDDDVLSSQYATSIEKDGLIYGLHGRQDGPPADLRCIDPATRKVLWNEQEFGYATLICCDDKLLITLTDGTLVLAKANSQKYQELARVKAFDNTVRALPALAEGRLYLRDTKTLKCFDLR